MNERPRQLVWIVLIGFALRVAVGLVLLPDRFVPGRDHWEFDYEVGKIAASVATGHGFSDPYFCRGTPLEQGALPDDPCFKHTGPTALEPPVYPALLAGIFALFGVYSKASAVVGLLMNCLFAAFTSVPLFWIGKRAFSARVGLWSAWLWAVFPYSVYWAAVFPWVTTLATLVLATLVLSAMDLDSTTRIRPWLCFGFLGGFAALTDPVLLSAIPFIAGWACYRHAKRHNAWKLPAAVAAMALIVTPTPWAVRNYVVFHHPIFLRDTLWLAVRIGNGAHSVHWWDDSAAPGNNPAELSKMVRLGEFGYMAETRQQALSSIREHPRLYATLALRRVVYIWTGFWSFRSDYLKLEPLDPANIPFSTGFTLLALLGVRRLFRERHPMRWLFILILLSFPAVYYLTLPILRYRGPIDPEVVLLSVYGLIPYLNAWRERRRSKLLTPAPAIGGRP